MYIYCSTLLIWPLTSALAIMYIYKWLRIKKSVTFQMDSSSYHNHQHPHWMDLWICHLQTDFCFHHSHLHQMDFWKVQFVVWEVEWPWGKVNDEGLGFCWWEAEHFEESRVSLWQGIPEQGKSLPVMLMFERKLQPHSRSGLLQEKNCTGLNGDSLLASPCLLKV